jgi:glycosyltransferase involved in cell wall biosynthesis
MDRTAQRFRDNPIGSHFYFTREIRYAERLRGVVVISQTVKTALQAHFPKVEPSVIHNWVGEEFQPRARLAARARLGIPSDRKVLLHVSIDNVRKNLEILPKIVDRLGPDYLLVRIGDSRRIARLFSPSQFLPRERVPDSDYPWYFNAADALVFPSYSEGFGVPLAEAVCSGLPVIASDIPIFRELLPTDYPYFANPLIPLSWKEPIQSAVEASPSEGENHKLYGNLSLHYRAARAAVEYREFFHRVAEDLT